VNRGLKSLSLKLAAAIILVVGSNAFGQGPLCSGVFLDLQSRELSIIADLAKLKMESDLTMAEGPDGSFDFETQLQAAYKNKFQEFIRASNGRYTEQSLKEVVRKEISQIQKSQIESSEQAERNRSNERTHQDNSSRLPIYSLQEHHDLSSHNFNIDKFLGYVPEANSLFWLREENGIPGTIRTHALMKYDLKLKTERKILGWVLNMTLFKDQKRALIINSDWKMEIVDLTTMQVLHSTNLGIKHLNIARFDISPNEKLVAIGEGWIVSIFDIQTGKFIMKAGNQPTFSAMLKGLRFLNDKEVIFNEGGTVSKLNIETGEIKSLKVFSSVPLVMELTSDLNNFIIVDNQYAAVHTVDGFREVARSLIFPEAGGSRSRRLMNVPGDNHHVLHLGGEYNPRFGIYRYDNLETPVFSLENYNLDRRLGNEISGVTFSADKGLLFVTGTTAKKPFLDIWSLQK
jgi:hypothetical protein